jgi:hypothetical protein
VATAEKGSHHVAAVGRHGSEPGGLPGHREDNAYGLLRAARGEVNKRIGRRADQVFHRQVRAHGVFVEGCQGRRLFLMIVSSRERCPQLP